MAKRVAVEPVFQKNLRRVLGVCVLSSVRAQCNEILTTQI